MNSLWPLLLVFLSACMNLPSPAERQAVANTLAEQHGWKAIMLVAGRFDLVAYLPAHPIAADILTIYIEGDGLAWVTGSQPSADPTPRDPLALKLALAQPNGNAAYLARPCQYVDAETAHCASRYWTEQRFAPEVIAATNQAVDQLKQQFNARRINLVGYSGGGAVAALLAARRSDVDRLVTVAGNLDHRAWTALHRVAPLSGSLNPMDERKGLTDLSQWHFVGGQDRVITPALAQAFAAGVSQARVINVDQFDHQCCWAERWRSLWQEIQ